MWWGPRALRGSGRRQHQEELKPTQCARSRVPRAAAHLVPRTWADGPEETDSTEFCEIRAHYVSIAEMPPSQRYSR